MNLRSVFAVCGLSVGIFLVGAQQGCGSDDEAPARRLSQKGEACQVTNDCSAGLSCLPVPGGLVSVCVVGEFRITEAAKECALIACEQASDCCGTPPPQCAQYLQLCNEGGPGNVYCQQYDQQCKCDTTKRDCESNKCVVRCTNDVDCVSSGVGAKCGGGRCVQCVSDDNCSNGTQCVSGTCTAPCQNDGDCPGFQRCNAGKCTASGCQTDRECVASTRNVEATCGTDGKCIVPCQTDLECGNPKAYSFFSCLRNQCVYMGCQSDKDCRLLLESSSSVDSGVTLGPKQHVVCRDKQAPGDKTIPAN